MKRRFKRKKHLKLNKYLIILLIYISFSITYNTLFNYYITKLSTEETINKIINDTKDNKISNNFLDKYKSPEYILKLTLNMDLNNITKPSIETLTINTNKELDVLIYNTHDTEKYNDNLFNTYNISPDVKLASNILEDKLNDLGINTYVERTSISSILKQNNWNYSYSYHASKILIEYNIKSNNYKLIIDLHRDSSNLNKTYLEHNNKPYAKILFVIGTDNENYNKNYELSLKLNNILEQKIPGISRGIIKKGGAGVNGIYNQDLSEKSVLIELGGQYNKIEDINNTLDILAESILLLLEGETY